VENVGPKPGEVMEAIPKFENDALTEAISKDYILCDHLIK
jgi:hypothetical protein